MSKNKRKKNIQLNTSPESYIKTRARNLPLAQCYINKMWKVKGFATILVSRTHTNGNFTFALFLVDLYCLGVKETFYVFNKHSEFHELVKRMKQEEEMLEVKYVLAHNIIYGAVEYAASLGFKPDKGFEVTKYLLEEDDKRIKLMEIEFGFRGKPAIFVGREKHPANIIATLERSVGKGNFTIVSGEDLQDNDWEEKEDDDELSEEYLTAISEGRKKPSRKSLTRLIFVMYEPVITEKERTEIYKIIDEADSWEIVDEDDTDDPAFLNKENEAAYELLYEKAEKNPEDAITEIEALIAEYPTEYYFHCLLSKAYEVLDDKEKEYETIVSIYKKFPQKITAFSNYIISLSIKNKYADLKALIGNEFDIHQFFPHRHKLSFSELVSLSGALLIYFSRGLGEPHKAIAYAITLCPFIFYDSNKRKADETLLLASRMMYKEIGRIKGYENNEINEMDEANNLFSFLMEPDQGA